MCIRDSIGRIFQRILQEIEFALPLRAFSTGFIHLSVFSFLQLSQPIFSSTFDGISFFIALAVNIILLLCLITFFYIQSPEEDTILEKHPHYRQIAILFLDQTLRGFVGKRYFVIRLTFKYLFAAILVFLQPFPTFQIIFLLTLEGLSLISLICGRPYKMGFVNIKEGLTEGCLILVIVHLLLLRDEKNPDEAEKIGWRIVILLYTKLALHIVVLVLMQLRAIAGILCSRKKPEPNKKQPTKKKRSIRSFHRIIPLSKGKPKRKKLNSPKAL
eukprot:TRINITY_DN2526_c0_g1_i2.p1 TRINITY_DN2526_c0_g1~~TRINITY_DN2526_c0_g1_i2.p1  ORF type:complete len:292 (+),score=46.28 TRINITY_DN2526_c0_g1_i2:62-877(+)